MKIFHGLMVTSRWAKLLPVLAGVACLGRPAAVVAAAPHRPNIVLIFADDLGWMDTGYQGRGYYETPNLDRLVREGMVFSSGYAAAGNCEPSRACLLSGQYTPRHEVYAVGSTNRGPKHLMRMMPIPNRDGLAAENVTLAEALKEAGYATGIFGKWHLDGPDGAKPEAQGFDVVFQSRGGWKGPAGTSENPKGIYSLTEAAGAFMTQNRERPFFVYLSHYAIHNEKQTRPASLQRFQAKPPLEEQYDPLYAACTYDLDDGVGRLLAKLAELGLERNTLVVFVSDNGGTSAQKPNHRGLEPWQEPLRGCKGCYYEGGIRVPFIVRWPGVVAPGTRCDVPIISQDLYPTFLAAAGAAAPAGKVLDGENLLPLLRRSAPLRREAIFWHFPGYLNSAVPRGRDPVFRTRPASVIRKGDWKLHLYHEEWQLDGGRSRLSTNRAVELYNLRDDIGERHDLAASQPAKRADLLDDLLAWLSAVQAKLPTARNPAYAPGGAPPAAEKQRAAPGRTGARRKTR